VIEYAMIFAAGFLAAALLALLIIPAVNRRAERLARRRVEALFPMSITELTAEKDHLRAEFAVLQRRLERKTDEALGVKQQSMEELGRRAVRIEGLETELKLRDDRLGELERELADTRQRLATTEESLSAAQASVAGTRDTLAALNGAHAKTLDELAATRGELDLATTRLNAARAELASAQDRLEERETHVADLGGRLTAALTDTDARRISISDLETRLATQTARADEFEKALVERRAELSDERQRLAQLARNLVAEQERGLDLDQRVRTLEAEREQRASAVAVLNAALEAARADRDALQTMLDERSGFLRNAEHELGAQRVNGGGTHDALLADNAALRRRIDEVADQIMTVATQEPARKNGPRSGKRAGRR
jgi:septal ring factor EnvC (AmiA/AmiB activator)